MRYEITDEHVETTKEFIMCRIPLALEAVEPFYKAHGEILIQCMDDLKEFLDHHINYPWNAVDTHEYHVLASAILPIFFVYGEKLPIVHRKALVKVPSQAQYWSDDALLRQMTAFNRNYRDLYVAMKYEAEEGIYKDVLCLTYILLRYMEFEELDSGEPPRTHRVRLPKKYFF
jgi:hypothetical protein